LTPNIAVITNAGGPGILATDAAEKEGLILSALDPKTTEKLKAMLPAAAGLRNPVDVLGDAHDDRYVVALEACMADPGIDGIVSLLTPQVMTPCDEVAQSL